MSTNPVPHLEATAEETASGGVARRTLAGRRRQRLGSKAARRLGTHSLAGIALVAVLSTSPAVADVVHFTNGDRLTGDLVDAPADLVAIDVPEVGIVTVPRTRVERVEEVDPAPSQAGDAASETTTVTTTDSADRRWEARADFGLAVATGNTRAADLNFVAGVKRHGPRFDNVLGVTVHKARAQADARRSDVGTTTTKDQVDVDYNLRWKYGDAWYAVANFEFFQDPIKDIDQRATTGAGVGHTFWETERGALRTDAGISQKYSRKSDSDHSQTGVGRMSPTTTRRCGGVCNSIAGSSPIAWSCSTTINCCTFSTKSPARSGIRTPAYGST